MKIRLIHLFLVCAAFVTNTIYAQRFKPGIIAGLVATDIDGVDTEDSDNDFHKAGFTVGGSLNTKLSPKNSVQFEILYTQKGSLQPADSANNYRFLKMSLDYVEVPLIFKHQLKFNINKKPVERFYIEAGPSFGRLVRVYINDNGYIYNYGNFRKNEVAINVGVGCRIVNNFSFGIRYSNSVIPVVNNNNQLNTFTRYTFNKGNNMVFSFTLRYVFNSEKSETNKE